jgi:predicted  nucleic acid-binding Zn-ribbon protein
MHSRDELSIHVGVDIPTAKQVQLHINDAYYESSFTNGLAVFRFNDIGIDYSGPIEIFVSDGKTEKTYKRAVSHFGKNSGHRLNEFLIVDRDFDNIEDSFDSSVVPLTTNEFVSYSDISKNSSELANPTTRRVSRTTRPKPPVPGKPTTPPMITNPIVELELKIKELESTIALLTDEKNKLVLEKSLLGKTNEKLTQQISDNGKTISDLKKVILANKVDMSLILARVTSLEETISSLGKKLKEKNQEIQIFTSNLGESNATIVDLNKTVVELNSTIADLRAKLSREQNKSAGLGKTNVALSAENSKLKDQVLLLQTQLKDSQFKNSTLVTHNTGLSNTVRQLQTQVRTLTSTNTSLKDSVDKSNAQVARLTSELEEASRVAHIPFISDWFYDPEDGWLYTNADLFPLVYKHESSDWHFYELGSHNPRYFYSYETDEWQEWK